MHLKSREGLYLLIKKDHPDFAEDCSITLDELNHYRRIYLSSLIEQERGEIDAIDKDVINALRNNSILTENIEDDIEVKLTAGQKMADRIATFGGSWTFIITFFSFILLLDRSEYLGADS